MSINFKQLNDTYLTSITLAFEMNPNTCANTSSLFRWHTKNPSNGTFCACQTRKDILSLHLIALFNEAIYQFTRSLAFPTRLTFARFSRNFTQTAQQSNVPDHSITNTHSSMKSVEDRRLTALFATERFN